MRNETVTNDQHARTPTDGLPTDVVTRIITTAAATTGFGALEGRESEFVVNGRTVVEAVYSNGTARRRGRPMSLRQRGQAGALASCHRRAAYARAR